MNINATLIGQALSFIVFVYLTMKYIWPPIIEAMAARQKAIADGLSAADRAAKDLELAKEKASSDLKDAKKQAAEIIEQANKRASQIVDEAKVQAQEEGGRIKASAQSEIEQELHRAREQLRAQVAVLAVNGAEKILGSSVDQNAHAAMLDKLATEL